MISPAGVTKLGYYLFLWAGSRVANAKQNAAEPTKARVRALRIEFPHVANLRFVFFDVGNTLLFANRPRILAPLHQRGIAPAEEQLRRLEGEVKNKFDDVVEHGGKADHSFWDMFYARLFEELDLNDEGLRLSLIHI